MQQELASDIAAGQPGSAQAGVLSHGEPSQGALSKGELSHGALSQGASSHEAEIIAYALKLPESTVKELINSQSPYIG